MGQVLHGSVITNEAVRRAIQHSQENLRTLSRRRYGINQKTVANWSDGPLLTGSREPRSTSLSVADEATVVAFRRHTLLPARRLSLRAASHHPAPSAHAPIALTCIAACSDTAWDVCRDKPPKKTFKAARSASFISISLRFGPPRESCICSSPSIASASSPSRSWPRRPASPPRPFSSR